MKTFDLAIAYVWEYDREFIEAIEQLFNLNGLSTFVISEYNVEEVTEDVKNKKINFVAFLDRASDVDDDFIPLAKILTKKKTRIFNPYKKVEHAIDKANMHLEFITAGLHVPYSIIIPPHSQAQEIYISLEDLEILGRPFIIKPCNTTGGGIGVVTGAETLKEVLFARIKHSDDKYLIQENIQPIMLDGKRSWFRCYWAFSKPICVWWDDQTHIYSLLNKNEIEQFRLKKLFTITRTIQKITGLEFFSTEIALTSKNRFVVIDYVNDQCDMRLKSFHQDGVPDEVVFDIINNLKLAVLKVKRSI